MQSFTPPDDWSQEMPESTSAAGNMILGPAAVCTGLGLQVLQQLGGINTVMYYTPAILLLAGVTDKRSALLLALVPAGVNATGTLVGMAAIDRCGRR